MPLGYVHETRVVAMMLQPGVIALSPPWRRGFHIQKSDVVPTKVLSLLNDPAMKR
jgi:hypothetical protein